MTGRYPQKVQAAEERALLEQEERVRAEITSVESVRIRHVILGTFPYVKITSLNQDASVATNADSDTLRLVGSPAKNRKKKWCEGSVASLKRVYSIGLCVLKILNRENLREEGKSGSNHTVMFPRARVTPNKNSQSVCDEIRGKNTGRNLATRKMRPQRSMGVGEQCPQAQKIIRRLRSTLPRVPWREREHEGEVSKGYPGSPP